MKRAGVKISILCAATAGAAAAFLWRRTTQQETARLATILNWRNGSAVADVGAGSGKLIMAAARRIGEKGQAWATDIDRKKLAGLRRKASRRGLKNLTVVEADENHSGLPNACCDSILLRGSYHHFTNPDAIARSLYAALRPGGTLVVVDFAPRRWLSLIAPVKRVPSNRGGHGIPRDILIGELTAAGFEV